MDHAWLKRIVGLTGVQGSGRAANRCKPLQAAACGLQRLVYACRHTLGAGRKLLRPSALSPIARR
eukprot:11604681-Alexandrium_andersonii.AAC.1